MQKRAIPSILYMPFIFFINMAGTLGKVTKYWKNQFTKRDSKLNFVVPENVATYFGMNGKKDDRNLVIHKENFRLQIGKMEKNQETIYSKDIVLWWLEYLLKKVWYNEKIIVQLRPDLAKYLCNEDQKQNLDTILSFEEEKKEIEKLIKKYLKRKVESVQIINVSEQYPEIFNILKEKGSKWLEIQEKPRLDTTSFSALSLLQYLYWVARNNKSFMQILYNTKSNKQKQEDTKAIGENESDYYAAVEIAIRLYEILKDINIQWWIDRQTKYDRMIWWILYGKDIDNFKIKEYPELWQLHDFCEKINPEIEFERVYITTKEIREIENKKIEKNKFKNQIILYTSIALLTVLSGIVWYKVSEYNQNKNQEEKNKELLNKTLLNKYSQKAYFDSRERNTTLGLQLRVSEASEDMYNDFLQIYWPGKADERGLDDAKKLMKQYFLQADSNWVLINIDKVYDPFIKPEKLHKTLKLFVSEYSQFLSESWFNIIPYPDLGQYDDACRYTQGLKWNITVNFCYGSPTWEYLLNIESDSTKYQKEYDSTFKYIKSTWITQNYYPIHTFNSQRYGHYLHSNWKEYDVLIVWSNDDKKFLLAYEQEYWEHRFDSKQVHVYTKTNWELVAKDFLENRYSSWISPEER